MTAFSRLPYLLIGALLSCGAVLLNATPMDYFSIGGAAEITQTAIDFNPRMPGPAVNGTGKFTVTDGSGIFASMAPDFSVFPASLDTGTIRDRTVPPQHAGAPLNILSWITFDDPAVTFALDLTYIEPGDYSDAQCGAVAATGQTCTPSALSPYNLSNFTDARGRLSSNANLAVRGFLRNTVTNLRVGLFNGVIGAEFLGQSYQQVLAAIASNNGMGSVSASYSGIFDIMAIPEPTSFTLFCLGSAIVGLVSLTRRHSARR